MRYPTNIQLVKFILHVLDTSDEHLDPILADVEIVPHPEIKEYILTHIKNSLNHTNTKAAKFVPPEHNPDEQTSKRIMSPLYEKLVDPSETAAQICEKMLTDDRAFITGSKKLACILFQIMVNNKSIAKGDLAVCIYRTGVGGETKDHLALLKLDPSPVYIHRVEKDADGNQVISLELLEVALPTEQQNLQKCAFIKKFEKKSGFDLMLLDRQVRSREEIAVAQFFATEFLSVELALDDRQRTYLFYAKAMEACNKLRPDLDESQYKELRANLDAELHYEEINLETWLTRVQKDSNLTDAQKKLIDTTISEELPDREFKVDRHYADGVQKERRFTGDFGLQVDIRADRIDRVIDQVTWVQVDGAPDHFEVRIRVRRWNEKVRFIQRELEELEDEEGPEEIQDVVIQPVEVTG